MALGTAHVHNRPGEALAVLGLKGHISLLYGSHPNKAKATGHVAPGLQRDVDGSDATMSREALLEHGLTNILGHPMDEKNPSRHAPSTTV